ncbi:MAG: ribonuclease E/G [Nitrospinota bacterium]
MYSEIIVNSTFQEVRIAVMRGGQVSELFIERKRDKGIVGNVYKGKVLKVLPGMQVAFVDIGFEKAGFLYVADIDPYAGTDYFGPETPVEEESDVPEIEEEQGGAPPKQNIPIEDLIREGQELLVQITKEPLGTKGARISSYITLPGRFLVYMPTVEHIGVSRRIESEEENQRLRTLMSELKPSCGGLIARTVGEGRDREDFVSDINFLEILWKDIKKKGEKKTAPCLINQDLDPVLKTIRDVFTDEFDRMLIDSEEDYTRCMEFLDKFLPEVTEKIEPYRGKEPIFDAYGIEAEIERALGRKIWLKSGGSIVIDQAEALTAIDVNTGKFVGKKSQEETILKTNLEAIKEIVYQILLRNIGGLIILDFIDMEKESNKEKVYTALEQALRTDRAKTNIIKISEFGLVEMTRKRNRESLLRTLCQPCPTCDGRGTIKSTVTVSYDIFREIHRLLISEGKKHKVLLDVSPPVGEILFEEESRYIEEMEKKFEIELVVKIDHGFHPEQYKINLV